MTTIGSSNPTTYLLSAGALFGEGIYDHREITGQQFFDTIKEIHTEIDCRIRNRDVLNYINRRLKLKLRSNPRPIELQSHDRLLIMRLRDYKPGDPRVKLGVKELDVNQYEFFTCTYVKGVLSKKSRSR